MDERRIIPDRRRQPAPFLSRHTFLSGQRKTIRRKADQRKHFFVDHYSPSLLVTVLLLLLLSVLDAYLTLELIDAEVIFEANPVMASYLEFGNATFFCVKFLFTSAAVLIFCVFNHFSVTRVSLALAIIMYFGVVLYQMRIMHLFFPRF